MRTVTIARADIGLFEESLISEHNEAMACLDWEEIAQRGTLAFRSIMKAERQYGNLLAQGDIEYSPAEDARLYIFFLVWIGIAKRVIDKIAHFEDRGFQVNGEEAFRKCYDEGRKILAASEKFFPEHAEAMDELRDSASNLLRIIVNLNDDWLPNPTPKISGLLRAIRKSNVDSRGLDEKESLALSDVTRYPGTILGELIERRHEIFPVPFEGLWEKR